MRKSVLSAAMILAALNVVAQGQTVLSTFTEDFEDIAASTARWDFASREALSGQPASAVGDGSFVVQDISLNQTWATLPTTATGGGTLGPVPANPNGGLRAARIQANDNDATGRLTKSAITLKNTPVLGDYHLTVDIFSSYSNHLAAGSSELSMVGLNTQFTDATAPTQVTGPALASLNADPLNAAVGYSFHMTNEGGYAGDVRIYSAAAIDDGPNFAKRNGAWTGTYSEITTESSLTRTTPGEMGFNSYYDTVYPASEGYPIEGTSGLKWRKAEIIQRGNIINYLENGKIITTLFETTPRTGKISLGVYDAAASVPAVAGETAQSFFLYDNVKLDSLSSAPTNTISATDTYATINAGGTSTVDGDFALTGLMLDGSANTLAGTGALNMGGAGYAAIYANNGAHVVNKAINLNSNIAVYVDQDDSLKLSNISYGANAKDFHKVGVGSLELANFAGRSLTISTGRLKLTSGLSYTQHLVFGYGPTAANGNATLLDVGRSLLAIDYPSAAAAAAQRTQIADRLNTGFNGGAWDGPGIISSDVVAAGSNYTIRLADSTDLGIADGTSWGTHTIDSSTLIFGFTFVADTNLDQAVDFDDLLKLAQNYDATGLDPLVSWTSGDSNFDGTVNFDDLLLLAQLYGGSVSLQGMNMDQAMHDAFESHMALAFSMVPEPTSLAALALGGLVLRRRR